ncbi:MULTISPECIES: putrescine export ABC transporter permease SapC [Photobacterium]|uniref:Peptide ABC transporter permease n=1 Tax=Photobacterium halotolerans TaxID=265726 RepID=A0A0F5VEP2_9GAMM|nr:MULTISPECIES: putrescine export ABC transporter permease SapC [Photobacterium]KKD00631.1 peptide ABC transporter permease [Photobacterium halotolerans]NAW63839.1 peptide ABC transporter permease SapC [Photobacterium halotolerans]NAW86765.1 peptide ABC transporter permease SapC [Photobacterium halotolerans]NAX46912.1 peptide ABC transporter permease SapC [Photobacterium halotolerans]UIP26903.1 peptide ABC transporter permease SapC [Photobacterium sp. TLY01]
MPSNNIYQEHKIPTQWERAWQNYQANSLAVFGLWCLGFLLLITIFAPLMVAYGPGEQVGEFLMPPSWDASGHVEFFFGTDDLGRDLFTRILLGSQLTFGYALLVALASAILGIVIGVLAGMTRGLKSSILNHVLDTVLSIPSLLLAIIIIAYMGTGMTSILLAIWLALIPRFIRAIYSAVHDEMEKEYIIAARLDGANSFYLLYYSILPNIQPVIISELTRAISIAMIDIAALGFLGLGAQSPSPEWGAMLGDSIELIYLAPWTVTLPGLAITFSILVVNLVGEGLRQAINAGVD